MQQNKVGEQRLYRLLGHFSLLILFAASLVSAATFEGFKKSQISSFKEYTQSQDKEFKASLESQWLEYNALKGIPLYEKPKPKNIASSVYRPIKSVGPKISVQIPKNVVILDSSSQKEAKGTDIVFNFYGVRVGFNIDEKIKSATYYPQNQNGVGNFFDVVASSDYSYLIEEIKKTSSEMLLNDWGIYLLVSKLSAELFSSLDNKELFKWFIFNKLGYYVKVGLSNKHISLMYRLDKILYATPSFSFGSEKYYLLEKNFDESSGVIYSYPQDYPDAKKVMDFSLDVLPKLPNARVVKELSFNIGKKNYAIPFSYNKNLIEFMSTYPQVDYEIFFNTPLDFKTYEEIVSGIKKHMNGMQASEAINFILHFVQNAFVYETDSEQFGYEKVMFAEETLYYEKSDCEDRAVLFSQLVKNILKISVVGVQYKDHMSTALYIPMDGDSVRKNTKRYVIADPTYINANVGQSMPKYKNKKVESFILVKP